MTLPEMHTRILVALLATTAACSGVSPDESSLEITRSGGSSSPTVHRSLAYGDFDGNGSDDWAAGFAESEGACPAGKVDVWYREYDPDHPNETWRLEEKDGADAHVCDANFGMAVAVGDFNGDGYGDLAAGAPGEHVLGNASAGTVHVRYDSAQGLAASGSRVFSQGSSGLADSAEPNDAFGTALASGDFNCDTYADLAIGVPGEDGIQTVADVGAAYVLFGGPEGLSGARSQFIQYNENAEDIGDWHFGSFLAAGNINGDESGSNQCDDLVVGMPGRNELNSTGTKVAAAGSVAVLSGGDGGLDATKLEVWHQGSPGMPDDNENNDEFGRSVWMLDDNGDGYDDLLVYSAGDDAIFLIYGSSAGLSSSAASIQTPKDSTQGWLRDACIRVCQFAWLIAPPGPVCDCDACEILSDAPPDPCPNCECLPC